MTTLEDVKAKLREALAVQAVPQSASTDASAGVAVSLPSPSPVEEALSMLDSLPDISDLQKRADHGADVRRQARVSTKIAGSLGIRTKLDAAAQAQTFIDQPTTWRDGYVRGCEDAQAHVDGLPEDDNDGG